MYDVYYCIRRFLRVSLSLRPVGHAVLLTFASIMLRSDFGNDKQNAKLATVARALTTEEIIQDKRFDEMGY